MARRVWVACGLTLAWMLVPGPADASIFSAIRALAKLGKAAGKLTKGAGAAGKGLGTAGKLAKGGVAVGVLATGARAARHIAKVSKVATAERAAVLFASLPDDAGRGAALIARDGEVWHLASRGADTVDSAPDLRRLIAPVADAARPVDLFLDPSVALRSADDLPVGAWLTDLTGTPRAWRTGHDQARRLRAWPESRAGELLDAALDGADLAGTGWDIAQVGLDLGLNGGDGAADPRPLSWARVGPACSAALPMMRWTAPSFDTLSTTLADAAPSRVVVLSSREGPDPRPHLQRWAQDGHLVVSVRLPDSCDASVAGILVDRAQHDAEEGDRLPLVMLAPLDASSVESEDPLLFCGSTHAAPSPTAQSATWLWADLCWAVPTEVPVAADTGAAAPTFEELQEPPLWVYGLGVLLSIPVLAFVGWRSRKAS